MKAYIVYTTTKAKEIELPDKFTPLEDSTRDVGWPDELWLELEDYSNSPEFSELCRDLDGDLCALETDSGEILLEW